ncbi:MAG: alpha/beta hydrolase [Oscillospiraceae bacterium]|nr:alpha/beta hydrolase [Oscillospiraceae bacterium]
MEEKVMQTPYGNIHYWVSRAGREKPWLVFLPGLSADHTLFEKQMEYFAAEWCCLVWDAPGHGRSRPFALSFSMEDLAGYLRDILKAEGIGQPVLIGQSMGGYIAQAYMARYPGEVLGFVSIDSCSLSRKYYTSLELAMLKHTKAMYMSIPWKLLLQWGIAGTATTGYGRELLEKMWSSYDKEEYCSLADHGMRLLALAVEARPEYPIACPVLLLCGEKDNAGSARSYNRRWNRQEGHRLVWLKGAGHNANTDAPEQTNRLIEEFAQSLQA